MPHALNAAYALLVREGRQMGWTKQELDDKLAAGWGDPAPDEQEAQDEFLAAFGVSMTALEDD